MYTVPAVCAIVVEDDIECIYYDECVTKTSFNHQTHITYTYISIYMHNEYYCACACMMYM